MKSLAELVSCGDSHVDFSEVRKRYEAMSEEERKEITEQGKKREREGIMRMREKSRSRLLANSGIPTKYQDADINLCGDKVQHYVQIVPGTHQDLILSGSFGTGKTYTACAILKALAATHKVRYVNMVDFMREFHSSFNSEATQDEIFEKYATVDVLLLDDLGKEAPREGTVSQLWALLDYRYRNELPTIITTNYTGNELSNRLLAGGDPFSVGSILDRIKAGVHIHLDGSSKRIRGSL